MSAGRSGESGGCGGADGHEWVPRTDTIRGPVDVASLDWECRRCGVAQTEEDRRNELNDEMLGVVRSLGRRGDGASP